MADPRALQSLLDALSGRAALVGSDGVLLSTNRAWQEPGGHPFAGPALDPGADYLRVLEAPPPELLGDAQVLATALREALLDAPAVHAHTFGYGPATAPQWSRTSVCPLDGPPRRVMVLHEDVTQQMRTQDALRRSQARLRTILTGAPILLFSLDGDGVFTMVEGMGGAGLGFVTEERLGTSIYEAYRHLPELLEAVRGAQQGHVGIVTQTVGHLALEIRCSPLHHRDRIQGVVGVATDVTERLQVQRMKDEFVSIVSHELRTPLTSIHGSLGLLEGGVAGALGAKAQELVRIARSNTDRLLRLIDDLLDFEQMTSGRLALHREALDAGALLVQVKGEMDTHAELAGVRVELHTEPCPPIWADRDRLVQVLANLLSNAIKFSPEGGRVDVRLRLVEGRVRISVTDEGPGIAPADVPRLFQKFHQLDASDARGRGGSGLGLVIAKSLMEAHGGRIGVSSDVGSGSTFYVELPVAPATAPGEATP